MNSKTTTTRCLALLLSLLMIFSAFAGCGEAKGNSSGGAQKTVTLTVVHKDGSTKELKLETDADNLREAAKDVIDGEESDMGLYVLTVDGETVNEDNQEWWCLTDKDGNMTPTGVDDTKISDGDAFTFTFTVGW